MTTYAELASAYEERRSAFLRRLGEATSRHAQVEDLAAQVSTATTEAELAGHVAALFQSYSEAEHAQLRQRIEALVTAGIEAVFGPIYAFKVTTTTERNQAVIRFSLETPDGTEHPVMDAQGGGLASIVGFILRVVVLVLRPGARRQLLVLDETFGMVSAEYHDRLAVFLRSLVDDLGLQLLLITHAPAQGAYADVVYRVSKPGTATVVTKIGSEDL